VIRFLARTACLIALLALPARAQPQTETKIDPLDIDGRTFDGVRLPLAPAEGPISLHARRAHVWVEQPAPTSPPGSRPVNRCLLEGDVTVGLGSYAFSAAAAAVWIERLPEPDTYQVFIYFDRVGTPTADAAVSINADRLPVQGVLRTDSVTLSADLTLRGRPDDAPLLAEGERSLAAYLRGLVGGPEWKARAEAMVGGSGGRSTESADRPFSPDTTLDRPDTLDTSTLLRPIEGYQPPEPIFARTGTITFTAGNATLAADEDENALVITDGVVVEYWDRSSGRTLQISAQRGVAFLEPGPLTRLDQFDAEDVRGIYLEGGVQASDGRYTVRGPRVYYDVRNDRAALLDAVFWTYDERRRMPFYVRAEAIRQQAANQFRATRATIANTAFFSPHLSVGASSITVTRYARPDGQRRNFIDARNITLRAGRFPFFYWPVFRGDPEDIPLRSLTVGNDAGGGTSIQTAWDMLALAGIDPPAGVTGRLLIDYFTKRGAGVGTQWNWDRRDLVGSLFAYLLPDDNGEDITKTGYRIDNEGRLRGLVLLEERWNLAHGWTLLAEGSYISDETLIDALLEDWGETRREAANRVMLRRIDGRSVLWGQVKGTFNDFTPAEYILQSRGYTVDRLPEIGYARLADDLLAERYPGLLSWSSETTLADLRFQFNDPLARELGFNTVRRSQDAFGIDPDQSIADRLIASGLTEQHVLRFDTRHELSARLDAGHLHLRPYLVGRVTAYDQDFYTYSPDETESTRLWGEAGVEASTTLTRVDDSVDSRLFDLHRLRHIIEPSASVWHAGSNIDSADLPVYDDDVESLLETTGVRVALDQTWQTKRGGPGRWYSVDVFKLNTELVATSDDADRQSPFPRYVAFRPELSNPGDYLGADAAWQVSDAVSLAASTAHDLEEGRQMWSSAGALIRHSPVFNSSFEVRHLEPLESTYLNVGASYEVGPKYLLSTGASYNTEAADFQNLSADLRREFPNAVLGLGLRYNNITDETSFGFVIEPVGVRSDSALRLRGLGGAARAQRASLGG